MRTTRTLSVVLCALMAVCALPVSCGETGPKTGTNTNWLTACDSDSDCGTIAKCLCRVCTASCENAANCAESGGICSSAFASATQCGTASSQALCLPVCASDDDCSEGQFCVANSCVHVATQAACLSAPGELACSTFDEATLGGWVPAVDSAATLDVVSSNAFDGEASLRAVWPGRAIAERRFEPVSSGNLYGRFWLRFEAKVPRVHVAQLDGDSGETAWRLVAEGETAWVETTDGVVSGKTASLPAAEWHCVRFDVALSDSDGTLSVWFDEVLVVNEQARDTLPVGGVTGFQVGAGWANGDATLYFDNALLSTEPVTCF